MPCGRKGKERERIYCNDEVLYIGGIPGEGSEEDQENIGKSNLDWRGQGGARSERWGCEVRVVDTQVPPECPDQGAGRTLAWIRHPGTLALAAGHGSSRHSTDSSKVWEWIWILSTCMECIFLPCSPRGSLVAAQLHEKPQLLLLL